MEKSPNQDMLPLAGCVEQETRHNKAKAERVRAVIAAMGERYTGEGPDVPIPDVTKERIPGAIGSVLLPHEYPPEADPPTQHGWRFHGLDLDYE